MPLALPLADERTFASLVADARSRIPRLAPSWTDHNAHDPGITLIELFAHLTETDLYRLGRVSTAQRRAFLRWFGVESRGPTVAETMVAIQFPAASAAATAPVSLGNDLEIVAGRADLVFSTTAPVNVQPAGIAGLFVGDRRIHGTDRPGVSAILDAPVAAMGSLGRNELVIALDRPATGEVSLYFWTGAPDYDDAVRRRLQAEAAEVARERAAGGASCPPSRFDDWIRHHDVDVAWEVFSPGGWTAIAEVDDRTRALTMSGFVRLRVDAAPAAGALAAAPSAYAIRVRAIRGRYEAPPLLKAILLNAVPARHQSRSFSLPLGRSDGRARQSLRVPATPAVPIPGVPLVFDQSKVTVTPAGGTPAEWTVAGDWDRAGPDTPVVVIDPGAAELRFGDGRVGQVPVTGAQITLISRVGGGAGGNVPANTLKKVPTAHAAAPFEVSQPFAARGGAAAASIPDLQARVLADLASPTRAATLGDFERLALRTPGLPSGRAHAIADHHPGLPGLPAPGCVTVVVVPRGIGSGPEPTSGFLTAVRRYLGRRRPVTTEVHVIGPTYRQVAVRARLHLGPYADAAAVVADASTRIDAFFHPLTGGPDGGGWPVGRDVYRSEVLALLQAIAGVHHVDELSLLVGPDRAPLCGNATVCPTDLIATQPHELNAAPARIR